MMESDHAARDFAPTADPNSPDWVSAPRVFMNRDFLGHEIPGPPTEIRSRWTDSTLHLLYICPYQELNLKPNPQIMVKTPKLWDWDVAEAFIGSDFEHVNRYKEFEVSPQGEWVDLDIDSDHMNTQVALQWNSGMKVKARIDSQQKVWYAEMSIPFTAISPSSPHKGAKFRIGLYRIAGSGDHRVYYAWSPTGKRTFHAPEAFGILELR